MALKLVDSIRIFVNHRLSGSVSNQETGSRPDLALTALSGGAFLALVVYCLLGAVMISVGGGNAISSQNENTYPENTVIYAAVHAAQTGHLYSSPSLPPFVLQPFGPLYYLINATIARVSHFDFGLIRTSARLLTYSCYLLSGLIIFLICRRLRFSTVNATLAAFMFLGQPSFLLWNVTVRPDVLFLTVMLLSLLLAVEGDTLGVAGYMLAGTLAGVAFLIKQPGVAAPIAVLTILLCRKKFRPAAVYAFSAGLPVVLTLTILLWHKGPFVEQFTSVREGLWSFHQGALFALDQFSNITRLVPILIGAIGFAQAIRGDIASQMIAAFALANWVVGLSGLPQLGSDVNYFLPGLAGCALLLPFAVEMIRKNLRWKVAYALIIVGLVWTTTTEVGLALWALAPNLQQSESPYVVLAPFKILSDRSIFTLHGRDPDLLDPYTAHELELGRHWDSSPIIEEVRRGDYDLVILAGSENWHVISHYRGVSYFSPVLVRAINENYSVLCSTLSSAVLMPRGREVEATPAMLGLVLGAPCGVGSHGRAPNLTVALDAQ
jgi:hypothetical protein